MMDKDAVLAAIDRAFGSIKRPETMVRNPKHCDECADHEAVMQAVTPHTISLEQIGNPGWDPVCYLSDDAYGYFMPGFARLALDENDDYIFQLIFHLDETARLEAFNAEQRCATAQLIDYMAEINLDGIVGGFQAEAFGRIMDALADAC